MSPDIVPFSPRIFIVISGSFPECLSSCSPRLDTSSTSCSGLICWTWCASVSGRERSSPEEGPSPSEESSLTSRGRGAALRGVPSTVRELLSTESEDIPRTRGVTTAELVTFVSVGAVIGPASQDGIRRGPVRTSRASRHDAAALVALVEIGAARNGDTFRTVLPPRFAI